MKDYRYCRDGGNPVFVAEMATADIQRVLADGLRIIDSEGTTVANIMERLRIELLIRELGL